MSTSSEGERDMRDIVTPLKGGVTSRHAWHTPTPCVTNRDNVTRCHVTSRRHASIEKRPIEETEAIGASKALVRIEAPRKVMANPFNEKVHRPVSPSGERCLEGFRYAIWHWENTGPMPPNFADHLRADLYGLVSRIIDAIKSPRPLPYDWPPAQKRTLTRDSRSNLPPTEHEKEYFEPYWRSEHWPELRAFLKLFVEGAPRRPLHLPTGEVVLPPNFRFKRHRITGPERVAATRRRQAEGVQQFNVEARPHDLVAWLIAEGVLHPSQAENRGDVESALSYLIRQKSAQAPEPNCNVVT